MKTKSLIICLFVMLGLNAARAQETTKAKVHEAGINFSSLNSFGIHYKTGSEKTLFRLTLLTGNFTHQNNYGRAQDSVRVKSSNLNLGFRAGFEKSVFLAKNLDFKWGIEAGCNYSYSFTDHYYNYPDAEVRQWSVTPGIYAIVGISYTLADHFVFGMEVTPGIEYSYARENITQYGDTMIEVTGKAFNAGFSTTNASLSVAYRF